MTTITNGSGVYATLGYSFSDPNNAIQPLSANTQTHLNTMPPFLSTWQAQDIAQNNVGSYFQNPVANSLISIGSSANSLFSSSNTSLNINYKVKANLANLTIACTNLVANMPTVINHADNLSGINAITQQNIPYYQNATSLGKTALYITNQTDGITNNSTILGSFGTILIGPQISIQANTLANDLITLTSNTLPNGYCLLSNTQIIQITSDVSNTNTLLINQRNQDVTFFNNLQTLVNNYNTTKQFNNLGQSQSYLLNNFIGTPKLISRINS
jgi:hypothetical protein